MFFLFTESTVKNCFHHVGFKDDAGEIPIPEGIPIPADNIWERLAAAGLVEGVSFDDYIDTDENTVTRETVTEASILANIHSPDDVDEDNSQQDNVDDSEDPPPTPTALDCVTMLNAIRCFIESKSMDLSLIDSLDSIKQTIINVSLSNKKQTSITDYFG